MTDPRTHLATRGIYHHDMEAEASGVGFVAAELRGDAKR